MRYTYYGTIPEDLPTLELAKKMLSEDWDDAYRHETPEEFSADVVPIMDLEIIHQWTQLDYENRDFWRSFVPDEYIESQTITGLMRIDLEDYYKMLFQAAYNEMTEADE